MNGIPRSMPMFWNKNFKLFTDSFLVSVFKTIAKDKNKIDNGKEEKQVKQLQPGKVKERSCKAEKSKPVQLFMILRKVFICVRSCILCRII